jgi:L-rhamnose mutarotase
MKRVGMTWRVRPAHWKEYRDIHLNPWPELITAIQNVGIHNYSIFAFPDAESSGHPLAEAGDYRTRVFAYLEIEGDDVLAVFNTLAQAEIKKRWDAEVTAWVLPEAVEGSSVQFMPLEPIFFCP